MSPARSRAPAPRRYEMEKGNENHSVDLQLGGRHLIAGGIALAALCFSFFFLGRWWERTHPSDDFSAEMMEEVPEFHPPREDGTATPIEVGERLTFFESLAEDTAPAATAVEMGGRFIIQVFATEESGAADRLAGQLKAKGYAGYVEPGRDGKKRDLFRVRVGPFQNRSEAERVASRLKKEEKLSTWVLVPE